MTGRPRIDQVRFPLRRPGNLRTTDFWNLNEDFERLLEAMSREGAIELGTNGKYRIKLLAYQGKQPWYFIRLDTEQDCILYHDICFGRLGFIHSFCFDCYKTVIVPHRDPQRQFVIDLFRLRDIMETWNLPSKVGVDIRTYTPNRYAGFVYGRGLEEGREYWRFVSESLKEEMPHAKVILKRACTEFELRWPRSREWRISKDQEELEKLVDLYLEHTDKLSRVVNRSLSDAVTFRFWIEYAYGIGDPTWKEALEYEGYEVPDHLYPPPDTYHEVKDGNTEEERVGGRGKGEPGRKDGSGLPSRKTP